MKTEDIVSLFKEKNFRATPQRIAVYDYKKTVSCVFKNNSL